MHGFTIKDFENLSGIKAHTIRIWEKRYALFSPERSGTNIRFYSVEDLQLIFNISLLNKNGFKISQLSKLQEDQLQELVGQLSDSSAKDERLVNELFLRMLHLDVVGFENALTFYINVNGSPSAIANIIYPFLQKIELLRNEKHLGSEYEHFISNIIRQKLIVGIEEQPVAAHQAKTIIAFSPEDDHYEMELLYAQYLLKKQGIKVIYLGTNVPQKDALQIANNKKPDFVYVQLNNVTSNSNAGKQIDKLSKQFENFKIVVTSRQLQFYHRDIPANTQLMPGVSEAVNFIAQ